MFKYIFGPVYSKRLGLSLGIDLLNSKICTFNCVYCEVRKTELLTVARKPYVKANEVIKELNLFFKVNSDVPLQYITFSGQGEPTLNSDISKVIKYIKEHFSYPICILTNGSLLNQKQVRNDLLQADLIVPSLDAVSDEAFNKINHPYKGITVNHIVEGIKKLREEFSGEIALEILFVKGINDSEEEIQLLKERIMSINPDKVYVNTIYRPPSFDDYDPISESELNTIQSDFESLLEKRSSKIKAKTLSETSLKIDLDKNHLLEQLKPMLYIRPSTLEDLYKIFYSYNSGLEIDQLKHMLEDFVEKKVIKIKQFDDSQFYCLSNK